MKKHCVLCKKTMTNNEEQATLNNFHYTYVEDVVDNNLQIPNLKNIGLTLHVSICDECDANRNYNTIYNCILNDIFTTKESIDNSKANIKNETAFYNKLFKISKAKWFEYYLVNVDLKRNSYWYQILKSKVDNLKLEDIKLERKKQKKETLVQQVGE